MNEETQTRRAFTELKRNLERKGIEAEYGSGSIQTLIIEEAEVSYHQVRGELSCSVGKDLHARGEPSENLILKILDAILEVSCDRIHLSQGVWSGIPRLTEAGWPADVMLHRLDDYRRSGVGANFCAPWLEPFPLMSPEMIEHRNRKM